VADTCRPVATLLVERTEALPGYDPGTFWDEMVQPDGYVRSHYGALASLLYGVSPEELAAKQAAAELSFRARGVTFALHQDERGVEKIMPFDLVPRLLRADEWQTVERGLQQRVEALNLFLHDIYHEQHIVVDGTLPAELVFGSRGYRRELRGVEVPGGVYTHVVGSDLVRDNGQFTVLEDNLRTPSGVSYVIENRRVLKRIWPALFQGYEVRPVEGYPQTLLEALRSLAPVRGEANVVVLTPGVYNSAFFEHAFLAKAMGVELVQGSDLYVDDGYVYMRTTHGPKRVDVIYRRIDDDYLDPLTFRPDSLLGVSGLTAAYRLGRVSIANALGCGIADDKAVYAYTPTIIRYYLGEDPILPIVPTYLPTRSDDLSYVLEHIRDLVVKAVDESGGYGMLIGPHATASEHDEFRARIVANPRGYIAQPTLSLSRHPCWIGDHLEARHVDLRPFLVYGANGISVTPGGLTRVALRPGSLVVNSSQGGGGKDTWVLAD
jgi:uncharacterized circularly permuted ATP-grasp superfamily protein